MPDLHAETENEDEDLVWNQSAMQTDNEKVKRQRESIFEKFRSAPNSPLLPSFMLAAPQVRIHVCLVANHYVAIIL